MELSLLQLKQLVKKEMLKEMGPGAHHGEGSDSDFPTLASQEPQEEPIESKPDPKVTIAALQHQFNDLKGIVDDLKREVKSLHRSNKRLKRKVSQISGRKRLTTPEEEPEEELDLELEPEEGEEELELDIEPEEEEPEEEEPKEEEI